MSSRKITFIINPISGTRNSTDLARLITDVFSDSGDVIEILHTEHRGHAREISHSKKEQADVLVAVGGDGSINEIASELLHQSKTALGIIPNGSGNGLSRSLDIPMNTQAALEKLKVGKPMAMDTCSFNGRPFFCTAGVAFDALVAKDFDLLPHRGLKTYFQASYRQFKTYKGTQIKAKINGEVLDENLFMMAFANAKQYGYGAQINPVSSLSDGILEIAVIKKMNLVRFGEFTSRLFLGTIPNFALASHLSTKETVEIETSSTLAHLDGEPLEFDGKAIIKIHPHSLSVIV